MNRSINSSLSIGFDVASQVFLLVLSACRRVTNVFGFDKHCCRAKTLRIKDGKFYSMRIEFCESIYSLTLEIR